MSKYHDEITRQPAEVERILANPHDCALDPRRPVRFTGIGTSFHACRIAEHWVRTLTGDRADVRAEEAHYFSLHGTITETTQVVVVSHRGTKTYPNRTLEIARRRGATTVAVTSDSDVVPQADTVLRTCTPEQASTHTVSYLSALTVLAQLIANTYGSDAARILPALQDVPEMVRSAVGVDVPEEAIDRACKADRILTAGFGGDSITAEEAALKLKEGTYKWTEALTTEFALHGPPAAYDESLHAFLLEPVEDDDGRTATLMRVLSDVGSTCTTIGTGNADIPLPECDPLARPLVAVVPFHLIVERMAAELGTNPDTIRTDVEPWAHAMTGFKL